MNEPTRPASSLDTPITEDTFRQLVSLLEQRYPGPGRVRRVVDVQRPDGNITVDNEDDAQETIRRLLATAPVNVPIA